MNYIEVKNWVPFRSSFMYVDSVDYVSDQIFIDHDLKWIRFDKKELHNTEYKLAIIRCHIFTKDKNKFYDCMEHLRRKLQFYGYNMSAYDYVSDIFELAKEFAGEEFDEQS